MNNAVRGSEFEFTRILYIESSSDRKNLLVLGPNQVSKPSSGIWISPFRDNAFSIISFEIGSILGRTLYQWSLRLIRFLGFSVDRRCDSWKAG